MTLPAKRLVPATKENKDVRIFTYLTDEEDEAGTKVMKVIADETGGTYKFVREP